jgi:BirA family biotin operon repressor/biotin-[acetyl-CoA-carboxylase] ligase
MDHLALFSPLAGLAVADGLAACCGLTAEIKWPNDVLLRRKKVCGVLAEMNWQGGRAAGVVLGIGVNVAPSAVPPAETLMFPAISVEEVAGHPVDRWELLAAILQAAFSWRRKLGSKEFFQSWEDRLAFKGEPVQIQAPDGKLEGQLVGIDPQGSLMLRTAAGNVEVVTAGDVSLRPAENS